MRRRRPRASGRPCPAGMGACTRFDGLPLRLLVDDIRRLAAVLRIGERGGCAKRSLHPETSYDAIEPALVP